MRNVFDTSTNSEGGDTGNTWYFRDVLYTTDSDCICECLESILELDINTEG